MAQTEEKEIELIELKRRIDSKRECTQPFFFLKTFTILLTLIGFWKIVYICFYTLPLYQNTMTWQVPWSWMADLYGFNNKNWNPIFSVFYFSFCFYKIWGTTKSETGTYMFCYTNFKVLPTLLTLFTRIKDRGRFGFSRSILQLFFVFFTKAWPLYHFCCHK